MNEDNLIIDPALALESIRQSGYRSTASAVAELIDNSIEANAKNIDIITLSKDVRGTNRSTYQVHEIVVIDDGDGMELSVLERCLKLGWGTRLQQRGRIGRFGFGLKGSSISQAMKVEVISWRDGKSYGVCLDQELIAKENRLFLDPPQPKDISEIFSKEFAGASEIFSKEFAGARARSGTMVVWSNLNGVDLKKPKTLLDRMNGDLCRTYRHFLDDDDTLGEKVTITLHDFNLDKKEIQYSHALLPNDPLYLLEPSNVPGSEGKATNIAHEDPFKLKFEYEPGKFSHVEVLTSIAKPATQSLGGSSKTGVHYGKNIGISFVRGGREIDFNSFGFVGASDPRERWWGIEVRFEPELDELFGVTNNKQNIRGFKKLDPKNDFDLMTSLEEAADDEDNPGRFKAIMHLKLSKVLSKYQSSMMSVIKNRAKKTSREQGHVDGELIPKINKEMETDDSNTSSQQAAQKKSPGERLQEKYDFYKDLRPDLADASIKQLAEEDINTRIALQKDDWPGSTFLDTKIVASSMVGVVNTRSPFYTKFWEHFEEADDDAGINALQILILSFVRTEDELDCNATVTFEQLRDRWGYWVNKLMKHAGN